MKEINNKRLDELEAIRRAEGGILKPERVVAFARNPATALHSWFEWDDGVAAAKYRLIQARAIIRLMVAPVDGSDEPVRLHVSVMDDRKAVGGGYRRIEEALADPALRMKVLQTAMIELKGFKNRYEALSELADVFAAIDQAEIQLTPQEGQSQSLAA